MNSITQSQLKTDIAPLEFSYLYIYTFSLRTFYSLFVHWNSPLSRRPARPGFKTWYGRLLRPQTMNNRLIFAATGAIVLIFLHSNGLHISVMCIRSLEFPFQRSLAEPQSPFFPPLEFIVKSSATLARRDVAHRAMLNPLCYGPAISAITEAANAEYQQIYRYMT